MSTPVIDKLNTVLADAQVFYQKLHHFHWSVKGPQFFKLHEKFEELYDRWAELVDDVAERVLQLGGQPLPTLAAALQHAGLREESSVPSDRAMVQQVVSDRTHQLKGFHATIGQAEEASDRGTANLLDPYADEVEKVLWMFKAWLG